MNTFTLPTWTNVKVIYETIHTLSSATYVVEAMDML
jgi:hypothetical protein